MLDIVIELFFLIAGGLNAIWSLTLLALSPFAMIAAPFILFSKDRHKFRKPDSTYQGSREWAQAHADRLAAMVGTLEDGVLITAVAVEPYPGGVLVGKPWGVVTRWQYPGYANLGEFGGEFLWLPK